MRTDKDEIARLKAEVLSLQKASFSAIDAAPEKAEKPVKVDGNAKLLSEIELLKEKVSALSQANADQKKTIVSLSGNAELAVKEKQALLMINSELSNSLDESVSKNEAIKIESKASMDETLSENKSLIDTIKEKDEIISDANKTIAALNNKIECINMLKIKNSELQSQVFSLYERATKAEAMTR